MPNSLVTSRSPAEQAEVDAWIAHHLELAPVPSDRLLRAVSALLYGEPAAEPARAG